ncbi:PAS domain-containing protein [Aurantiacibacter poecillastricola]|uniref:PAS domain-containing protein n=1 Tax=Aurantiacibacter poecillastricola TaxID=3064385 RepID=UPI00273DE0F2|nr:PAS domain-containing protein [Aurantiacibacter sp. 219JJ12-13]MDP5262236.1 PAS domain-containing protein [Aurantiacibacter sp. 219JJ12-13]
MKHKAIQSAQDRLLHDESKSAYERLPFSLSIADLEQDDAPLVFVNRAFEKMTGYASSAVLGRNCRFLQGDDTDPQTVEKLAEAVKSRADIETVIFNYRANGEGFWNRLTMGPLYDDQGECRYYVGFQCDLGSDMDQRTEVTLDHQLAEIQHRVKNHLSMIVGMIRVQAPQASDARSAFDTLARRVEALQLLYQEMDQAGAASATAKIIPLGAYLGRIASAINHIDGRRGIKMNFNSDTITVPVETAGRIGLIVSEVLTNSMQHAFKGRAMGVVSVRCRMLSNDLIRITVEDDGVGIPDDCKWPQEGNLGARIVRELVRGMNGKLEVGNLTAGAVINIDIPLDQQAGLIEQED